MSSLTGCDIELLENYVVKFEQDASFENFIAQFQEMCPKLLCIVNGTSLRLYDKKSPEAFPQNIRFDYKQQRGKIIEYYFRDIDTDNLYCVFGRECAKIFYPQLNKVDPAKIITYHPPTSHKTSNPLFNKTFNQIVNKNTNQNINQKVKSIRTLNSHIPSNNSDISANSNIAPNSYIAPNSHIESDPPPISQPNYITIIDKGMTIRFPNPNYLVEIREYNPV